VDRSLKKQTMIGRLQARRNPFRRLQWRLPVSYTLVTVGALIVVELLLAGALLLLLGSDFLAQVISQAAVEEIAPEAAVYLGESPADVTGLNEWLESLAGGQRGGEQGATRITRGLTIEFDENQRFIVLDANQTLLAQYPPAADPSLLGQPFDTNLLPGLGPLLPAALSGERDSDRLYATVPGGTLIVAAPVWDEDGGVRGVFVMSLLLPRLNLDTLRPLAVVVLYSVIPFTLAAGLVGTIFGFLTARGLSRRLGALSQAADAWSEADFATTVSDRSADELGQLARRLNLMAEQLQNLMHARQELATLEERSRLARDLHDSVKQQVFATTMQIGAARASLPGEPERAVEHLDHAEELARGSQRELAALIQELRPAALEGHGLAAALRAYTESWSRQTGIRVQLRVQGEQPLPLAREQALFRVTQEALSNVSRHSKAHTVDVHLAWQEKAVTIAVADDGRGFDAQDPGKGGFGLLSMKERVEALGGDLILGSDPGGGARITASIPALDPAPEKAEGDSHE
jgi:NarL family two-component system sensor histidine kinase LiaS